MAVNTDSVQLRCILVRMSYICIWFQLRMEPNRKKFKGEPAWAKDLRSGWYMHGHKNVMLYICSLCGSEFMWGWKYLVDWRPLCFCVHHQRTSCLGTGIHCRPVSWGKREDDKSICNKLQQFSSNPSTSLLGSRFDKLCMWNCELKHFWSCQSHYLRTFDGMKINLTHPKLL